MNHGFFKCSYYILRMYLLVIFFTIKSDTHIKKYNILSFFEYERLPTLH